MPREAIDDVFDSFDVDGAGSISYEELRKTLARAAKPAPAAAADSSLSAQELALKRVEELESKLLSGGAAKPSVPTPPPSAASPSACSACGASSPCGGTAASAAFGPSPSLSEWKLSDARADDDEALALPV